MFQYNILNIKFSQVFRVWTLEQTPGMVLFINRAPTRYRCYGFRIKLISFNGHLDHMLSLMHTMRYLEVAPNMP